jgi:hypothetical protein
MGIGGRAFQIWNGLPLRAFQKWDLGATFLGYLANFKRVLTILQPGFEIALLCEPARSLASCTGKERR